MARQEVLDGELVELIKNRAFVVVRLKRNLYRPLDMYGYGKPITLLQLNVPWIRCEV
jgi:hypothetical protein